MGAWNYHKKDLRKATSRVARIFSIELQHLSTDESLQAFEGGLKHWPDFIKLIVNDLTIQVTLADRENRLGRLTTDEEAIGRIVDLAIKFLVPQGEEPT